MIKTCIKQLLEDPQKVSQDQIRLSMTEILSGQATPAQTGAFLIALRLRGELPVDVATCASCLLDQAEPCDARGTLDIVGTGGDGIDTVNVSTAAAIVVAACGIKVAKHGNRAASSKCGSADFLEKLGARVVDLDGDRLNEIINQCNFGFLFAPRFHPGMRYVANVRRELGCRTIFNILGPLTNPAKPKFQLTGVSTYLLGPIMAQALIHIGVQRGMVVHSAEGLDEISPAGTTYAWLFQSVHTESGQNESIQELQLHPEKDFGLPVCSLDDVRGGNADTNVALFNEVINGKEGPVMNFILLQASAALFVAGAVEDFRAGVAKAREALLSGKVKALVEEYVTLSRAPVDM